MLLCMRTTLDISDELLTQAKHRAVREGIPLRQLVETALRGYLRPPRKAARYKLRWKTDSGRVLPGVRLDDRDALLDLMEGRG